jgi:hypothetical protein
MTATVRSGKGIEDLRTASIKLAIEILGKENVRLTEVSARNAVLEALVPSWDASKP